MSTNAVPSRARTAFVLAGGGSLGAAQVSMLRARGKRNQCGLGRRNQRWRDQCRLFRRQSYAGWDSPNGAIASALHAITLLTTRQLAAELNELEASAECHILPTEGPLGGSPFDFSRTSGLLERSYRRTLQWLHDGGLHRSVRLPPMGRSDAHAGELRRHSHSTWSAMKRNTLPHRALPPQHRPLAPRSEPFGFVLPTHRYLRSIELRPQRYWPATGERSYPYPSDSCRLARA
jgi:hypothetical protein